MKKGITIIGGYDHHDRSIVIITKRRGKLTLDEIEDALRYGAGNQYCGHYAILLNCSAATLGGSGYFDEDMPKGDEVSLYPLDEGETCPVCDSLTPPYNYCPVCGTSWKDCNNTVETLLEAMKEESVREIQQCAGYSSKVAWYWSHVGALDMASQLGLITDDRRQELYAEFRQYNPAMEGAESRA